MPLKDKEQRRKYYKEYNSRPEIKERKKERNKRSYSKFEKTFFVQNFNTKKRSSNKKFPDRIFDAETVNRIYKEKGVAGAGDIASPDGPYRGMAERIFERNFS